MQYIIALDQGTTSSRAIAFDTSGKIVGIKQKEFTQYFPQSGWVEHDPEEIWTTQFDVFRSLVADFQIDVKDILAIGITNQRETTVVWNAETGEPVYNAIVWQDKRTSKFCDELKGQGKADLVRKKTGLVIDAYFSGTKLQWFIEHVPEAGQLAKEGKLRFGTIDTWLIWKMTKGAIHATDQTNASRTMMYNIQTLQWDEELMAIMGANLQMMPEVKPSVADFGFFEFKGHQIPIKGVAGDQQAALFGQACLSPGMAKNTYGTGCFMLMNMGAKFLVSSNGLLTTLACSTDGKPVYALEGSIFIAGAAIQWLRDALRMIDHASDSAYFAQKVESDDVVVVPAFAGLGAPYWDQDARGAIFGLTRDTGKNHIIKATLQAIAYQTRDVINAMEKDAGFSIQTLKVDGGATTNQYLMQFQADILGTEVDRPKITESTALGAAFLAGIGAGIWQQEQLTEIRETDQLFYPQMPSDIREKHYARWNKAVSRTVNWLKD